MNREIIVVFFLHQLMFMIGSIEEKSTDEVHWRDPLLKNTILEYHVLIVHTMVLTRIGCYYSGNRCFNRITNSTGGAVSCPVRCPKHKVRKDMLY